MKIRLVQLVPFFVAIVFAWMAMYAAAASVAAIGAVLLVLHFAVPMAHTRIIKVATAAGGSAGRAVATVLLAVLYFTIIVPWAFLSRTLGKLTSVKSAVRTSSYWVERVGVSRADSLDRQYLYEGSYSNHWTEGSRIPRAIKAAVVVLTVLLVVDYSLGVALDNVRAGVKHHSTTEAQIRFEMEHIGFEPIPFLFNRSADFAGRFFTIKDGIRRTVPNQTGYKPEQRIFMFGGSSMWGYAARDDLTIPSHLISAAATDGWNWEITNYAERGYVSWQSVLLLSELCASGNVPDVVVFYDGFNDVYARHERPDESRSMMGQDWFDDMLTLITNRGFSAAVLVVQDAYLEQSFIRKVILRMKRSRARTHFESSGVVWRVSPQRAASLEHIGIAAAGVYLENVGFVEKLADVYGFSYLFVWQPTLATKGFRSTEEDAIHIVLGPENTELDVALQSAARVVGEQSEILDLSALFNGETETIYSDPVHVLEHVNQRIAEQIYPKLADLVSARVEEGGRE